MKMKHQILLNDDSKSANSVIWLFKTLFITNSTKYTLIKIIYYLKM